MFTTLVTVLDLGILVSSLPALRLSTRDRVFSFALLRCLFVLPLLAGQYFYLAGDLTPETARVVLLSESLLAILWGFMAYRLGSAMDSTNNEPVFICLAEFSAGIACFAGAWLLAPARSLGPPPHESLAILHTDFAYPFSLLLLLSVFMMAWNLEKFWRNLEPARRWEYKFLVAACALICCSLTWAGSYRLTYLRLWSRHFALLGGLLLIGWLMMLYAAARHRLLNRKIFISRTIIQTSFAPVVFGTYLVGLGTVSLISHRFDQTIDFVLFWLFAAMGFAATILYLCSGRLRRRVHYFISTHFYVNKYEYRDEWLSLSHLLRGAVTESDIVKALAQVLSESLYTRNLLIWLSRGSSGYCLLYRNGLLSESDPAFGIRSEDPLIQWLKTQGVYRSEQPVESSGHTEVRELKAGFLNDLGVVLLAPIPAGDELLGVIGLGEEFTGGRYGHDDFDLLAAVGSQVASALLAVRKGNELADLRRNQAIDKLSAFVLHDLKNASAILSLVSANAPAHFHNPEFQADMLEAVDDALKRMGKVEKHLSGLRGELKPHLEEVDFCELLRQLLSKVLKKPTGLQVTLSCPGSFRVRLDREFLAAVLENLVMNSFQAGGEGTEVAVEVTPGPDGSLTMEIRDNGPGIPETLLPQRLFEPFQSSTATGSGIGLWQAREMIASMGGTIRAENTERGARFIISLPLA